MKAYTVEWRFLILFLFSKYFLVGRANQHEATMCISRLTLYILNPSRWAILTDTVDIKLRQGRVNNYISILPDTAYQT